VTVFTLMLLVGLVATGAALAWPAGVGHGGSQQTRVVGTIEFVDWVTGDPSLIRVDPTTNEFVNPVEVLTYEFHGSLEGTYVESIIVRAPVSPIAQTDKGPYTLEGRSTFVGTLNGKAISWAADLAGAGYLDPAYAFRGWETSVATITSSGASFSCLRGTVISAGMFDGTDPTYGASTYSGFLTWQKN
jgi:hypothetical protein